MEIFVILILTLLNGFFSLSEIALVSVKKSRIEHLAAKGDSRASTVLKLLANPENFLSSVQVGITLIGIVSGAYGGATLTDDMESILINIPLIEPYSHIISLIFVIGCITYFTIVIGELVPKTIAMNNAEAIALTTVPVIKYFTYATFPFVKLLSFSTKLIIKIIGAKETDTEHVSEEELKFLLLNAGNSGVLEKEESEIHQNIFHFTDQTAKSLMTHASEVEWINIQQDAEAIQQTIMHSSYSKFIASDGQFDNVQGIIYVKDYLDHLSDPEFTLKGIIQKPIFVSQNTPSFRVLNIFRQKKQYIALVIDEFGGVIGLITLHDLIEAIVGDLPEEDEDAQEKIHMREDGTYLIDGKMPLFELNKFMNKEIIEVDNSKYTTLAGFILFELKTIPKAGDSIEYENYYFEVIDIDGRRIDKVLMKEILHDSALND